MNPTPIETVFNTDAGKISAKTWGPSSGKPVIAIHGWLDNAASFDPLAPYLSSLRLIAIDLSGHGLSDHRPNGTFYHFTEWIWDILQIAEQLNWNKFGLIGHSLGGALAAVLAGTFPEKITEAVLIESPGPLTTPSAKAWAQLRNHLTERKELPSKVLPTYESLDRAVKVREKVGGISHTGALALVLRGIKEVENGFTWRSDPRLTLSPPFLLNEEQVHSFLSAITCRTLVIQATQGLAFDKEALSNRTKCLQNVMIHTVEGGHHIHLDHPNRVGPLISSFFESK